MDQPADPQTPLAKAYQAFFADLAAHGVNAGSPKKYRYDILRFERWLIDTRARRELPAERRRDAAR